MADTGFVLAGQGRSVANGSGAAWSTPGNITASDDNGAGTVDFSAPYPQSANLVGDTFGLSVPTGATIDGIEIQLEGGATTGATPTYMTVGKDDSTLGTVDTSPGTVASNALNQYGGSTDLWGLSWTAAEVNASTFQARIRVGDGASPFFAEIDAMWIKVYYTEAGGDNVQTASVMMGL